MLVPFRLAFTYRPPLSIPSPTSRSVRNKQNLKQERCTRETKRIETPYFSLAAPTTRPRTEDRHIGHFHFSSYGCSCSPPHTANKKLNQITFPLSPHPPLPLPLTPTTTATKPRRRPRTLPRLRRTTRLPRPLISLSPPRLLRSQIPRSARSRRPGRGCIAPRREAAAAACLLLVLLLRAFRRRRD